jgi:phosphoglycolate phosphatase
LTAKQQNKPVYKLIIFDWDGTLMDSTEIIARAIQDAAKDFDLKVPTTEEAKYVIGLGLADSMVHLFPNLSADGHKSIVDRFRIHYLEREFDSPLYPGVKSMLGRLHADGCRLAIATGKARRGLDRVLDVTGLKQYFEVTRCADEGFPKPHPDMLERILDHTGTEKHETVMIGDTTHDLELAKNAGVDAIAVTYGAHRVEALRPFKPAYMANTAPELTAWLLRQRYTAE